MNKDLEELRTLAKAIECSEWSQQRVAGKYYVTRDGRASNFVALCQNQETADYIAAIHPKTILLLLETIEQQAAHIALRVPEID